MVRLIPTGKKRVLLKDNKITLDSESAQIRETWVNSGGSFNSTPLLTGVGNQPFRLPSGNRQQLLDESYRLWKYDPLGGNIVRTTTYFTLGRGLVYQFDDKTAQFYAKKFYSKNKLEIKLRAANDEANALGEVYIWLRPKFTDVVHNGATIWRAGDTQVTFIAPDNITNIEVADKDVGDVHNYTYEYSDGNNLYDTIVIPDITKYNIEGSNIENGCIIQIKLNAGNMDPFGHSDLIPVKEWLDNYQEFLRDGVIINKLYRSPCYDISIVDGTPDEVSAAMARYRGWSIGSNPVHNDREVWQILEFKGPNNSNQEARRALLLIIAAGVGFAEFMLADGSNSNLASSKTQQLPVIKRFEDRQEVWGFHLMQMFQFALRAKAIIRPQSKLEIDTDEEGDYQDFKGRVEFPQISQDRDVEVAQTNELAVGKGYMSLRTAAARLNLDLDREIEQMMNDIEQINPVIAKLKSLGLKIALGGNDPNVELAEEKHKMDLDTRKRDRSSEGEGANAKV